MHELWQLLEHLITYGPARNPAEAERLLRLADVAGGTIAAAAAAAHTHPQAPDNEPPAQAPQASQEPLAPAQAPAAAAAPFGGTQ